MLDASRLQIRSLDLEKVTPYPLFVFEGRVDNLVFDSDANIFVLSIHSLFFMLGLIKLKKWSMIIDGNDITIKLFIIFFLLNFFDEWLKLIKWVELIIRQKEVLDRLAADWGHKDRVLLKVLQSFLSFQDSWKYW